MEKTIWKTLRSCFPLFPVQFDKWSISQEILFPYKMCNVARQQILGALRKKIFGQFDSCVTCWIFVGIWAWRWVRCLMKWNFDTAEWQEAWTNCKTQRGHTIAYKWIYTNWSLHLEIKASNFSFSAPLFNFHVFRSCLNSKNQNATTTGRNRHDSFYARP